ncbi:MAG TPA: hypothetical protein VLT79_04685 [Gemmatimonadales bacterium]|nr:hypothetical protein [Gemmatimonadales bacterium]
MPRLIFWDVDTQYDFLKSEGKLYVPESEAIIPRLAQLTNFAHQYGIRIVASADDHIAGHAELSDAPDWRTTFPPHCMRDTPGQEKIPETRLVDPLVIEPVRADPSLLAERVRAHRGDILFLKHRFDVFTNANVDIVLQVLDPEDIVLYGVALDVCDRFAIEGLLARRPQTRLFAVTDAMKPIDRTAAQHLLKEWAEEGVRLVQTAEVVEPRFIRELATAPHD